MASGYVNNSGYTVDGINVQKKHKKARTAQEVSSIQNQSGAIDASNVMLMHKGTATRVGFKFEDGKKVRFAKSTGEVID